MHACAKTQSKNYSRLLQFRPRPRLGRVRWIYAGVLCKDPDATLDDLREAVTTLEDTERTARRVFGGAHPLTKNIEETLRKARAALRARETT